MKYSPLSSFPVAVAEVCAAHAQQSLLGVVLVADAHDVAAVDGVGVQVLKVWKKDKYLFTWQRQEMELISTKSDSYIDGL